MLESKLKTKCCHLCTRHKTEMASCWLKITFNITVVPVKFIHLSDDSTSGSS